MNTALGLRRLIPGRPIVGTNTLFAALIGSWDDPSNPVDAPYEMLSQAIDCPDSNTSEPIIGLGQWLLSPQTTVQQFRMGVNLDNIMQEPRLLLRNEEGT